MILLTIIYIIPAIVFYSIIVKIIIKRNYNPILKFFSRADFLFRQRQEMSIYELLMTRTLSVS